MEIKNPYAVVQYSKFIKDIEGQGSTSVITQF
jgi:hypothetical protein